MLPVAVILNLPSSTPKYSTFELFDFAERPSGTRFNRVSNAKSWLDSFISQFLLEIWLIEAVSLVKCGGWIDGIEVIHKDENISLGINWVGELCE